MNKGKDDKYRLLYAKAVEAINNNNLDILCSILPMLADYYDWAYPIKEDNCIVDFIKLAVVNNNEQVIDYLLNNLPSSNMEPHLIKIIFDEDTLYDNIKLFRYVLDYCNKVIFVDFGIIFRDQELSKALRMKNTVVIDLIFYSGKLSLCAEYLMDLLDLATHVDEKYVIKLLNILKMMNTNMYNDVMSNQV